MPRKRHKPEEIVAKLRQVDVLVARGTSMADAIRSIGVTEMASGRVAGWGDLLLSAGSRSSSKAGDLTCMRLDLSRLVHSIGSSRVSSVADEPARPVR